MHAVLSSASGATAALQQLRQELLVLKQQLVDEKLVSSELREELHNAQVAIDALRSGSGGPQQHRDQFHMRERDDLRSRLASNLRNSTTTEEIDSDDDANDISDQLGDVFRASSAMTIRYVPPVDFLPAVFVEQYADVLMIVDRYAQLYHKYHVGGGQRDPALVVRDEEAQRSEHELLESRVRQLEVDVKVRDDTIEALKEQLVAWRTTGRDRAKFDPAARLDDTVTTNATVNPRRRNDDGDVSSSDHSYAPHNSLPAEEGGVSPHLSQRRASPRRERRRQLQPALRAAQPVPQFEAISPQTQGPLREQPTPLLPLDASSPTDRPGRSGPPANHRTVFGSAPPAAAQSQLPFPGYAGEPPATSALGNPVAPDLLGLYAPPRQLFGVDPWSQPPRPNTQIMGPGGVALPDVQDQYTPTSVAALRHPWGDLMQYT
jgi:hypothetical protein